MSQPKDNKKNIELSGQTVRNNMKFKISSACNYGQCVGVAKVSSFCDYGQCGVVKNQEAIVVQDTKNTKGKPLSFTYDEWKAFVTGVKNGEFDVESL